MVFSSRARGVRSLALARSVSRDERLRLLHFWTFMRRPLPRPVVAADEGEQAI